MRLLVKLRSIKIWLIIGFLAMMFFLGNIYFLKPANSLKGRQAKDEKNSKGLDKSKAILVQDSKHGNNDESKKEEPRNEKEDIHNKLKEKYEAIKLSDRIINVGQPDNKVHDVQSYNVAVLVIACNRPTVSRCLDQILKYKPENMDIPIIVSQDCGDAATENVIKSYGDERVKLFKQPDLSDVKDVPDNMAHFMGYYKISRHYKFALTKAFDSNKKIDSVIIIEDDLDIAPDFFEYFLATRKILDMDKSVWCVSAWNDNGREGFVKGNDILYRTDFFPGLGWMITREIWNELKDKWPKGFWDDWMRNPQQRQGRACIRPEISRSKTFGKIGVSMGQFYDQYLRFIKLNDKFFSFTKADLSYLLKKNYDRQFVDGVYSEKEVSFDNVLAGSFEGESVRIEYESDTQLETMMKTFGIMTDFKAGVPRTAYKGIITFMKDGKRIYLTPYPGWDGYNEAS
eukprot:gene17510-19260_t